MNIIANDPIQEIIISEYEKSQKNIQPVWIGEGWYKSTPNSFNYFASGFEAGLMITKSNIDEQMRNNLEFVMNHVFHKIITKDHNVVYWRSCVLKDDMKQGEQGYMVVYHDGSHVHTYHYPPNWIE